MAADVDLNVDMATTMATAPTSPPPLLRDTNEMHDANVHALHEMQSTIPATLIGNWEIAGIRLSDVSQTEDITMIGHLKLPQAKFHTGAERWAWIEGGEGGEGGDGGGGDGGTGTGAGGRS
ncbi:hypothetical protein HZH66_011247 [Vespula vulgaris]|uniref:Uncharacterized protein n=1 Tax=Vespula vulgaris TaxID=7454 RepID=A0A834MW91_VESVU|nr:hypothetical protein HZH66_011247 [Vespula vulgaris]